MPTCQFHAPGPWLSGPAQRYGQRDIISGSMSQTERVLRIQQMLQVRKIIPRAEFLGELEVSPATFKRDLEFLRSRFQVNIEWNRERGGYYCEDRELSAAVRRLKAVALRHPVMPVTDGFLG